MIKCRLNYWKSALGLPKICHDTPLLQALKVKKIDNMLKLLSENPNDLKWIEFLKATDWDLVYNLGYFETSFKFFHDTFLTILVDSSSIKNVKIKV